MHNSNKVAMEGTFVLPNDSNPNFKPTAMLPIQILHAWASAEDFNLPILLEPLGDTTLTSGSFNGEIAFEEQSGLLGNIDFKNLKFNNIPPELLKIQQMNLSANKNKIELLTDFEILNGTWTGNANIVVDDVFEPTRKVSLTYISPNSGHIKSEGVLNNDFEFLGTINLGGMWLIPETRAEIEKTDLKIDVQASLREGLKGISSSIQRSRMTFLSALEANSRMACLK